MTRRPADWDPVRWEVQRERLRLSNTHPPAGPLESARPLSALVPGVLEKMGLDARFWEQQLLQDWETVVGAPVARHTRPGRLMGKTLLVYVSHSTWLAELSRFGKPAMLKNLQARFGPDRIADVRLQLEPDEHPGSRERSPPAGNR